MTVNIIQGKWSKTLKKQAIVKGKAPFSGKNVKMTLFPRQERGIIFEYLGKSIPLLPQSIKLQPLQHTSTICGNGIEVIAIEHLLSALYGLQIDNLLIRLEGDNQIPALDSSSETFTKLLSRTGVQKTPQKRQVLKIIRNLKYSSPDGSYAFLSPAAGLSIEVEISFNNFIGQQKFQGKITRASYQRHLCWGRTFIRSPLNGDPAKWKRIRKLIPALPENPKDSPILVFSDEGFITNLFKPDEPVRHKALDLLGDLALLGMRIEGKIKVYKPGHLFNQQLVQFLDRQIKK